MDIVSDDEDENDLPSAPWIHLLYPQQRAWRDHQLLKGHNPDRYIEEMLRKVGKWPVACKPAPV